VLLEVPIFIIILGGSWCTEDLTHTPLFLFPLFNGRFCEGAVVSRNRLQLVGVTALLIACKYEEVYPPEVSGDVIMTWPCPSPAFHNDLPVEVLMPMMMISFFLLQVRDCVYITDHAYTREDILKMEERILKLLNFQVTMPTTYGFLQRFLTIVSGGQLCQPRAEYYAERALQEYDIIKIKPSLVAAASVYVALKAETLDCWVSSGDSGSSSSSSSSILHHLI